nr:type II secretion system F family protein [Propionicimonas sp.]
MVWSLFSALAAGLAVVAWRGEPGAPLRSSPARGRSGLREAWHRRRQRLLGAVATAASALLLVAGLGWWGVPAAVAVGAGSYVMLGRLVSAEAERRREQTLAQLPQACDLLAVALEAGLPLRRAVEVIAAAVGGPLGGLMAELAAKVRLGVDEAQAWTELGAAQPVLSGLGREVARTIGSGVALSRSLRALGAEFRKDAAAAAQVRARKVGVRSVLPLMVCFLPAFLLLGVVPIIGGVVRMVLP